MTNLIFENNCSEKYKLLIRLGIHSTCMSLHTVNLSAGKWLIKIKKPGMSKFISEDYTANLSPPFEIQLEFTALAPVTFKISWLWPHTSINFGNSLNFCFQLQVIN